MEPKEIKALLSMEVVLRHYGLRPDKHDRLLCPFHPDKTPSLQIYPKTNTFCCFSSNCNAGTGDTIQFIQLMEKCNKHEALVKAASLVSANPNPSPAATAPAARLFTEADELEKAALMGKVFGYFKKALPLTKKAVDYLQGRTIDYTQHEIGYNSGGLHGESKNHHLVASMEKYGLLKPSPVRGHSVWARDCVIFPLRNAEHKIVSLYGRSITNDSDQRHFYLAGREGLYPGYPKAVTTRLILVESIIDAASLLQQPSIKEGYEVLALYGTNGLTDEHSRAIIGLKHLEEIIFILNGDDPGKAATGKHYTKLRTLLPSVKLTAVAVPEGEDVNSLLQSHDDPGVLADLVERRAAFSFSPAPSIAAPAEIPATPVSPVIDTKLITTNPELLIYDNCELRITVLGGIRITGLDRMRVTLKVEHKTARALPLRHNLDLYNHPHTEQLVGKIAESFDTSTQSTMQTIAALTSALESYRAARIEHLQAKPATRAELTPAEIAAAIKEWKTPNLLERINHLIGESGIVGEPVNRLIAFIVYTSRKLQNPLHLMFLGSSGSGKTYLQEKVSELIPKEDRIEITQITENAFYYFRRDELRNKLLLIEDLDGAESSMYPLRELQSKRRISKTVTLKDTKGNLKTITLTVEGPVSVSGCTTRERLYEDNANRCLLVYIDASTEQDKRIMEYQARISCGEVDQEREQAIKNSLQNMQRVLKPVTVVNPYAKYIQLPEQVFKPRRTMGLLLSFIEAITLLHQYQREVKQDSHHPPYIETTVEDIEAAFSLLKDVLFSKSDELTKATRGFLELLKVILREQGKTSFTAREIRERLRLNPNNLKRYLVELERYGYIKGSGNRYRGNYEYTICNVQEYEQLKTSIDQHLQTILVSIRNIGQ
jgi:DNA primase/ABC-type dipeptide/oligopeptide/nickel transport system ATPase component